ncbi:MAG: SUMF1/EgtB/PvdO family nonheme iron enzyme [Deltaproteobacteria bacterium]|nr:SUMF1/EgtB/PvdO family nonheme iron enzyme [Deltaproteobacteria bacterium]
MWSRLILITAFTSATLPAYAWQEQFGPFGPSYVGRLDFVFVGASLTDNQGLQNGVNCLKSSATATVRKSALPQNPKLIAAILYIGGSLIDEIDTQGQPIPDYDNDDANIFQQGVTFPTDGIIFHSDYIASTFPDFVAIDALAATPRSVRFLPPGAANAVTVTNDGIRGPYSSVLFKYGGPEQGNLAFFLTPIDVTKVILDNGGVLEGDYEVSGLLADVCHGKEVICSDEPNAKTCATNPGSTIDTNGAASFALFLMVEDLSLPQRSITVFEGLSDILNYPNGLLHETLNLNSPISSPASGTLAFYGLEGDLLVPLTPTAFGPGCAGSTTIIDEYIQVNGHGDATPEAGGICLYDDDNPYNNIFNATINQEPSNGDELRCTPDEPSNPDIRCCKGDSLCGVVGVDIDRFNISDALTPGVTKVDTWLHSSSDEFYLAAMILGIDVFAPTLKTDTQIRVLNADVNNNVRIGTQVIYSIAISNTGNVAATNVRVSMDAPSGVTDFTVQIIPAGAQNLSSATAGSAHTGRIDVNGFSVNPGKVAEIRFAVTTTCHANTYLNATAQISANEITAFDVDAPLLALRGPGDDDSDCRNIDIDGPFALHEDPTKVLRGGGGCNSLTANNFSTPALTSILVLLFMFAIIRRFNQRTLLSIMSSRRMLVRRDLTHLQTKISPYGRNDKSKIRNNKKNCASLITITALLIFILSFITACGSRHKTPSNDTTIDVITPEDPLPGTACNLPLMVEVIRVDDSRFCIDRFEASIDDGNLGQTHQGYNDDTIMTNDGSTLAKATIGIGIAPRANVSWYQAMAACANAGKHLCSTTDWERACRAAAGNVYPYGNVYTETLCNGFFAYAADKPAVTGSFVSCVSSIGAYDMSGNLEEWTASAVERQPGLTILNDRAVRGGGYAANAKALACSGSEYHAPPGEAFADRGFRCCVDLP